MTTFNFEETGMFRPSGESEIDRLNAMALLLAKKQDAHFAVVNPAARARLR